MKLDELGVGSFARAIVLDKIVDEHADEICPRTWASQRNVSQAQAEIRRISISLPDGTDGVRIYPTFYILFQFMACYEQKIFYCSRVSLVWDLFH